MARRTRAEADATRAALLKAARGAFHENGVARTSLQEIARRAGVTRGALYWHFQNKADILKALIQSVRMPFEELVEAIPESQRTGSALDEVRQACELALVRMEQDDIRQVHAILIHRCEFFADINPQEMLRQLGDEAFEASLQRFRRAESCGELNPKVDAETANWLFHTIIRGLVHSWHQDPSAFSIAHCGRDLLRSWFRLIEYAETGAGTDQASRASSL